MNEILTLASDFVERMSNPAYGVRVNEDYSYGLQRFCLQTSSEVSWGMRSHN